MNWKRIGRSALCLLLVCALIVNISPIKAKALEPVSTALGIGIAAVMILAVAGVVFIPKTEAEIEAIGNSMKTYMYQWGTEAEQLDVVEEYFANLTIYQPGNGDDESPNETKLNIAKALMGGLALWIASIMKGDSVEVPKDGVLVSPSYSSLGLPELPGGYLEEHDNFLVLSDSSGISLIASAHSFYTDSDFSSVFNSVHTYYMTVYKYTLSDGVWSEPKSSTNSSVGYTHFGNFDDILWTSSNVCIYYSNLDCGTVAMYVNGHDAAYTGMNPSAFLGDVYLGVQDGTLTEEAIEIPETLEYGEVLTYNGLTGPSALNQICSDLSTGVLSYEEYKELLGEGLSSDTGTDSDTSTDTDSGKLSDTSADTFIDSLVSAITAPFEWAVDALLTGIKAIFVPSEDFLTAKVEALRAEFAFADSIITTGGAIGGALVEFETSPPIIYMELANAEGSIYWGERAVALDLRWYERYKPTVDTLLSALLWIWFAWRVFRKLPDIISGISGDVPDTNVTDGRFIHTWYASDSRRLTSGSLTRRK